jgi:hypothetical protein
MPAVAAVERIDARRNAAAGAQRSIRWANGRGAAVTAVRAGSQRAAEVQRLATVALAACAITPGGRPSCRFVSAAFVVTAARDRQEQTTDHG